MKQPSLFIFIAILLSAIACETTKREPRNTDPIVSFHLKNTKSNNLLIYACSGSRQLLLDSIPIKNDSAAFFIPKGTPNGIYRFVSSEMVIDLILSNENVKVVADPSNLDKSIDIVESRENAHFYNFLYEYMKASANDSISCEKVEAIRAKYNANKEAKLANQVINLVLFESDCGGNDFCMNEFLLSSPYADGMFKKLAIKRSKEGNAGQFYASVTSCSDTSSAVKHSLAIAFYDAGVFSKNLEMIKTIIGDSIVKDSEKNITQNILPALTTIEPGSLFPSNFLLPNNQPAGANLYYIIITDKKSNATAQNRVVDFLKRSGERYFLFDSNDIEQNVKNQIGYVAGTMVYMIGKYDILADKWIGENDLKNLIAN
ncbi:MAG: hypothetical protein ACK4WD_05700 [Flavobacteriales bacterium]|jgi:hypothetical protein